jgi:cyclopropane fatty-acyl-phospholipid synthase-like methyltransferase
MYVITALENAYIKGVYMEKQYWDNYYKSSLPVMEPSAFAISMKNEYINKGTLLELGCGNGRDCLYFAKKGIQVTAIDESEFSIKNLQEKYLQTGIKFIADDFVVSKELTETQYDYIYSRFTVHSISEEQQEILFKNVYNALNKDGLFMIEVRSIYDELFGKGEPVGRNAYIFNDHYRRFIDLEELQSSLIALGFNIILSQQSRDLAQYKSENPIVIRLIAKKQEG